MRSTALQSIRADSRAAELPMKEGGCFLSGDDRPGDIEIRRNSLVQAVLMKQPDIVGGRRQKKRTSP